MNYQQIGLREDGSARLDCFIQEQQISTECHKKRPAIIVCPGGAYLILAHREGEPAAMRFAGLGYQTFVCRYLTYMVQAPGQPPRFRALSHYPEQLVDLMHAVALVREHADEWGIDPQRVYVLGFSAGAHLCCMLAENWDDPDLLERAGIASEDAARVKPDGMVLCYPMLNDSPQLGGRDDVSSKELVTMALFGTLAPDPALVDRYDLTRHVRPDMPRTFVWHTTEDKTVSPLDTMAFVTRMMEQGVPCELHMYQRGRHGQALCDRASASKPEDINVPASAWVDAAQTWLQQGYEDAPLAE